MFEIDEDHIQEKETVTAKREHQKIDHPREIKMNYNYRKLLNDNKRKSRSYRKNRLKKYDVTGNDRVYEFKT